MSWNRFRVLAASAVSLAAGGVALLHAAPSASRQAVRPASGRSSAPGRCDARRLRLTAGPLVSEATQQSTRAFVLRNTGPAACALRGYPAVTLLGGDGRVLPFRFRHRGDQELTGARPRSVRLPGGGDAYVAVNKNACVTREHGHADRIELTLPQTANRLSLRLARYPLLGYCPRGDPGHTVDVTPIEPTLGALWSRLTPGAGARPSRGGVPECRSAQLRVRIRHSFAGLGSAGAYVALRNRSGRTCWMAGWPTLEGITASGRVVHARDAPAGAFPDVTATGTPRVLLRRGQRADAVFGGADGPRTARPCGRPLRWLEVGAPGAGPSARVSAWIAYLDAYMPTCSAIRVSPVMPAADLWRG